MKKIVVKKDYITEVQGVLEYMVEKFNLAPLVEILNNIFQMILAQITTYPMLKAFMEIYEKVMARVELFRKVSVF
jgi:hypothetical protein